MKTFNVAVVGATGAVGREILKILHEREFPVGDIHAVASGRSVHAKVSFGDKRVLTVQSLDAFDFAGVDIGLFSPGEAASGQHAPRAAAAGCIVIDNTSRFRMEPDVPLVVSEVNPAALDRVTRRNIVANPNCGVMQLAVALKPLHDRFRIRRVVVSTYQSVSGAGKEAMDELYNHTKKSFVSEAEPPQVFPKEIAFNVIPQIGSFEDDGAGQTGEELKIAQEARKILDPDIRVFATCVRVPVFIGHSLSVTIECERPVPVAEARAALRAAPGLVVTDTRDDGGYMTPAEVAGEDPVYVSRIRRDPTVEHGLAFWCVADNLRKGAALNAVQIAEALVSRGLITGALPTGRIAAAAEPAE